MTSCGKKDSTNIDFSSKSDILSLEEKTENPSRKVFQIDGLYFVNKDTFMYANPEDGKKIDKISKNSSVKILEEEKNGFIRVDYFGNQAYMKTEDLDIDS